MHEVELVRRVMTRVRMEADEAFATVTARVIEFIIHETLRELGVRIQPDGQLEERGHVNAALTYLPPFMTHEEAEKSRLVRNGEFQWREAPPLAKASSAGLAPPVTGKRSRGRKKVK